MSDVNDDSSLGRDKLSEYINRHPSDGRSFWGTFRPVEARCKEIQSVAGCVGGQIVCTRRVVAVFMVRGLGLRIIFLPDTVVSLPILTWRQYMPDPPGYTCLLQHLWGDMWRSPFASGSPTGKRQSEHKIVVRAGAGAECPSAAVNHHGAKILQFADQCRGLGQVLLDL